MADATAPVFDVETDVLVVGAGGCGLVAALAAADHGAEVLVLEKSPRPGGNTARSTGMVLAAGTRFQREAGLTGATPERLAEDVLRKNHRRSSPEVTLALARGSAPLVEWMVDDLGVDLRLVTDFKYPGHSEFWMHATPSRIGLELVGDLLAAVKRQPRIQVIADARAVDLVDRDDAVVGAVVETTGREVVGARKTILAANGFAANREMVKRYCPEVAEALHFGHDGNTGEAIRWGESRGAALDAMGAYQGHGSVAYPHGTLVTWATIVNGGFLVNAEGRRFGDESRGYSEYAREVLTQPEGVAYLVIDNRIFDSVQAFEDVRECVEAGVFHHRPTIEELARVLRIDPAGLAEELRAFDETARGLAPDRFGRRVETPPLAGPFVGTRVTGALFHTQGGLRVDSCGRVLRADGARIPNLYAGGGTAVGVSGPDAAGYLSGNGLLAALGLGKLAGDHAGRVGRG